MIQRLDCSKCGINQADTDKPFVALPMPFICQDCFRQQISTDERIKELERENKHLKIWLDQYEEDATALIEEHGCDPDDKIDREVLKRMLNYLIGENRRLKTRTEVREP